MVTPECIRKELEWLLSIICIGLDCVVIVGDFNIHVGNPQDREAKQLCCVLDIYGLTQHVTEPTHTKGHTLDLIISKEGSEHFQGSGDWFCSLWILVFSLRALFPCTKIFKQRSQSWVSVSELVDNYTSRITNVIDAIAPTKLKAVPGKKRSPWRHATLLKNEKREWWKAERRWWKTNLICGIYKETSHL